MFEILTEKLTTVLQKLSGRGRLTEHDVDEALKQIRMALLEADVNFKVARDLVTRMRERAVSSQVIENVNHGQQVVKVVHEELTAILSGGGHRLIQASQTPTVVMLVGLQGSGKTTTAAKLALHLRHQGQRSLLIAGDLRRPAAVEQLAILGKQLDVPVYQEDLSSTALKAASAGGETGQGVGR